MRWLCFTALIILCGLLPPTVVKATPALAPSFLPQDFQRSDTSIMSFRSGIDVIDWGSIYRMQGTDLGRFAVTRTVNIRQRNIRNNGREWTFDEDVMFRGTRPLHRMLELRGWVHADAYSDEFQHQMHWVQHGLGVAVIPVPWAEVFPSFGFHEDFRQGYRDRGSLVATSVLLDPPSWGNGSFAWGVEELGNRQNRDLQAGYRIRGDFEQGTFDEFEANYQERKRSYYLATGGEVAQREEIQRRVQNQLGYPLGKGHDLRITTSVRDSRVQISTGISRNHHREVETAFQATVLTSWKTYSGQILYEWNAQNQEFDDDRINGRHQALRASGTIHLSPEDRLSINASVLKNQFDTPDTMNFDDRDEWSTRISLVYSRPINRFLTFSQELAVYLDHLVYIYAEKSEYNYWRRVFRLGTSLTSTPFPGVVNRNSFLVTATYREYDFEPLDVPRSDVYRRYTAMDSLHLPLIRHVNCLMIYRLDLEDRGLLDWSEWIQQISEEYRAQRFQITVGYRSSLGWELSGGWVESLRLGWRYDTISLSERTKSLFQEIHTSGPTLIWNWSYSHAVQIQASGQWQWVEDRERGDQSLLFADINLRWHF